MVWMGSKTNIAEIITLDTTNFQDNIVLAATGELVFLQLNKLSTATVNNVSVWNATPVGRWHLIGGKGIVDSGASTIVSASAPTTVLASGTIYVWMEDTSGTKPADADGNYPNSTITYVSNGTIWKTINACKIHYLGSPTSAGKLPNDIQEEWVDLNSGGYRYGVTNQSSSTLTWEII